MKNSITMTIILFFLTSSNLIIAELIQCRERWNTISLGPGKIFCQLTKSHLSCKVEDCWVGEPPARDDSKYNVTDHVLFKDCHKYKGKFGDSKQEKASVQVQASAYWYYLSKGHVNVIGHEPGKKVPKDLPGYRCYDMEAPLPVCQSENCELLQNPK
ncbi:secreted protein [Melampsora americana]|nr:secreted protein [Melampsora americana]